MSDVDSDYSPYREKEFERSNYELKKLGNRMPMTDEEEKEEAIEASEQRTMEESEKN